MSTLQTAAVQSQSRVPEEGVHAQEPATKPRLSTRLAPEAVLAAGLIALAVAVRLLGFSLASADFRRFIQPWSDFIAQNGGFAALRYDFADYNVPYLYVLVGLTWLDAHTPVSLLVGVKAVSVFFDGVLAWYAFRLVSLRHPGWRVPVLAGIAVLFLPSVILDGAFWAQCDSIYAALSLAGLYHLLRERPWLGCALFGVAYAVKQQTVFILPILLILVLAGRLRWRCLLALPGVYLLLAVPAWLAGRPWGDLLTIYAHQSGHYRALTMHAPSVYTFVSAGHSADEVRTIGVLFTAAAFLTLNYVVLARRLPLTPQRLVVLSAVCVLMAPLLLPAMHERYFYLADVLTVVAAFWVPRRLWFVPMIVAATSFMTYQSYVFGQPLMVDLRLLTLVMTAALVVTLMEAVLRRGSDRVSATPRRPAGLPASAPARPA